MAIKLNQRTGTSSRALTETRNAVFCELSVKSPQSVLALAAELKLEPGRIREALAWGRFRKVRGGVGDCAEAARDQCGKHGG